MTSKLVPLSALPLDPIVALNNDHAIELSYADAPRMQQLIDWAYFAVSTDDAAALLIAFDQSAAYDSDNFFWCKARYDRFVYVDRVVVSPKARGRGLAKRLYATLFAKAKADGFTRILCEVNSDPPNPASDAFHAAHGFVEIGTHIFSAQSKRVRYLLKDI
jgi:uncharacterized protein